MVIHKAVDATESHNRNLLPIMHWNQEESTMLQKVFGSFGEEYLPNHYNVNIVFCSSTFRSKAQHVGMGSCPHNLFVHVITFLSHFLQTSP
jgi:hypothetical protein